MYLFNFIQKSSYDFEGNCSIFLRQICKISPKYVISRRAFSAILPDLLKTPGSCRKPVCFAGMSRFVFCLRPPRIRLKKLKSMYGPKTSTGATGDLLVRKKKSNVKRLGAIAVAPPKESRFTPSGRRMPQMCDPPRYAIHYIYLPGVVETNVSVLDLGGIGFSQAYSLLGAVTSSGSKTSSSLPNMTN